MILLSSNPAYVRRLFKKLDESKATGHDKISAHILKRLADFLAILFTQLCRRLLYEGCWPSAWKYHLIIPIFFFFYATLRVVKLPQDNSIIIDFRRIELMFTFSREGKRPIDISRLTSSFDYLVETSLKGRDSW